MTTQILIPYKCPHAFYSPAAHITSITTFHRSRPSFSPRLSFFSPSVFFFFPTCHLCSFSTLPLRSELFQNQSNKMDLHSDDFVAGGAEGGGGCAMRRGQWAKWRKKKKTGGGSEQRNKSKTPGCPAYFDFKFQLELQLLPGGKTHCWILLIWDSLSRSVGVSTLRCIPLFAIAEHWCQILHLERSFCSLIVAKHVSNVSDNNNNNQKKKMFSAVRLNRRIFDGTLQHLFGQPLMGNKTECAVVLTALWCCIYTDMLMFSTHNVTVLACSPSLLSSSAR